MNLNIARCDISATVLCGGSSGALQGASDARMMRGPVGPRSTGEEPMSHKFKVGEIVTITPTLYRNVPGGVYEVTRQLPHNGSAFQYRIKNTNEPHERVARESELTKA